MKQKQKIQTKLRNQSAYNLTVLAQFQKTNMKYLRGFEFQVRV